MNPDFIGDFKSVLYKEGQGILDSIPFYGEEVEKAGRLILDCQGKLIVCGVGKSGHVGEKIAATFASTGTPSFFLHATEAVHGDAGMVRDNDVVLFLSNSGATKEVLNALAAIKPLGPKTISITSNKGSALAKLTDISIAYHYESEADQLNLAPTVSSTLTLAVGDALACAVSKMRGFSSDDFHRYHPGGALGEKLSK